MAGSAGRAKRDREKAKQERQQAKRERKQAFQEAAADAAAAPRADVDEPEVLASLAELHRRFADEEIDFEEFEETKARLLADLAG